jgi:ABC-type transporter Mla subunit MlaD
MLNRPKILTDEADNPQPAQPLAELCLGVLPVWAHHLATSRAQSEVAVTQMLKAFADIGPHIDLAERQSKQITEALSQTDGGITRLTHACERVLAPVLADPSLPASTSAALSDVLNMVRRAVDALEDIAKPFEHETKMVAEQVERMYMGFQYQDRISQMMALIEGDIARLQQAFASNGVETLDLAGWLLRLESQYAMAEQHFSPDAAANVNPSDNNNETTFF